MNKTSLIHSIKAHLQTELAILLQAAELAHAAAVDEQSIAETQYDTLAIEAGYLAEGQSKRALAIQAEIKTLELLTIRDFNESTPINLGALVQLSHDESKQHWFFILPVAAGYKGEFNEHSYTVITPQSPMGKALINQYQDDDINLLIGTKPLNDFIQNIL